MSKKSKFEDEVEEQDSGGEALMTSFADTVTLLLGFFIILYSMSHLDEQKFYELGRSIADGLRPSNQPRVETVPSTEESGIEQRTLRMLIAILNLGSFNEAVERVHTTYQDMRSAGSIGAAMDEGVEGWDEINVFRGDQDRDREAVVRLILPEPIIFAAGSDQVQIGAQERLKKLAAALNKIDDLIKVEVIGHTDSRPPSSRSRFTDNWQLSTHRATEVARTLERLGVSGDLLAVVGRGHHDPLVPEYSAIGQPIVENFEKNRRIEIAIKRRR